MGLFPIPAAVSKLSTLSQRLLVAILLIPSGVLLIALGGWVFAVLVALALGTAAWEYWRLFKGGGYRPSLSLLIAGVVLLVLARQMSGFDHSPLVLALLVLADMAVQVIDYERGEKTAALDFNINLGGTLYLGWLGSYLISLRTLPDGLWWFMLVLPAIWIGDGGAYLIGRNLGRHKMAPLVSPKKTWEGYVGGVVFAALGTAGLAAIWHLRAPAVTPLHGLVIGLLVAALCPIGDLGESMLKRGFGVKDSSNLLPGHGGALDRIDSWLWAGVIGYYLITWLWL